MQSDLSSFNNSWYYPGNKLRIICWYFVNVLFFINPLNPFYAIKRFLLRLFGCKLGKNVLIKPSVNIKYPWFLEIGNNVWIGENVWIDNLVKVTLRDNVCISQGAMLLCGNHDYKKSSFDYRLGEIYIEDGAWVGAKSVVCPGVRMASHSILSVGAIANRDLEPYTIYQGNPAVKIRQRVIEK
ncbi:MAG: WcaF family extracellular polysaccharide biosynthesis acetyltransferase [Tannerellaceae bacterium]|jgi:putative colanic acid biosynthesis acetyltransferase WcaF|nr:WcaF family extracellular polysaccharide biosynthesis acetyltransferase [Tannerellaceae bacterium]